MESESERAERGEEGRERRGRERGEREGEREVEGREGERERWVGRWGKRERDLTFVKLSMVVSGLLVDSNVSINCANSYSMFTDTTTPNKHPYCIMKVF